MTKQERDNIVRGLLDSQTGINDCSIQRGIEYIEELEASLLKALEIPEGYLQPIGEKTVEEVREQFEQQLGTSRPPLRVENGDYYNSYMSLRWKGFLECARMVHTIKEEVV